METIISSIISGVVAIVVCVVTQEKQASKTTALIEYKIDELSRRVNEHNNLVERTYKLEKWTELQEEKIKVANHRIEDLERREV